MTRHYTKGDITIVWKPELCQHSKICWTELRTVFDPFVKPWINPDGAEGERIVEQVSRCPSGALSHIRKENKD